MKGGYYKYEVGGITFVTINTLLWSIKNAQLSKTDADEMLTWFTDVLKNSGQNDKFVINSHIYAGEYNSPADDNSDGGKQQTFFDKNYTEAYKTLMITYKSKILMV